ncbi:hypothetical protein [Thermoactinomyces sp. DSM 45892]|uniref:hypothetical protein n=1 Tax=Thermoactinomyces sp. DSM 45892 TaxID=1882753 RepID=UPI00089C1278|nr:hypothetical protein [Thermoactinomyces sp. DSM 45892]SDY24655.1 hypothetical protein SAMN05444416_10383 [Thermoactinomyces sp. DSM 45892]
MRNEFFLEDHAPDQNLFEQPKPRRWRPGFIFFLIVLVIAGGSAITYFITQPSSSTLTAQSSKPQPEPVEEPIAAPSTQTEPSEPALVEPYRGDQAGFPELIAHVPSDDSNTNKGNPPIKEQNPDQNITTEKQKGPDTPKQKNQLSKETRRDQIAVNPEKQNVSTQVPTSNEGNQNKGKQKSLHSEKQIVTPTQKHEGNPSKKPTIQQMTTPEKQQPITTHSQTITPQAHYQPKMMQQMIPDDQKQTSITDEGTSPSNNADKSIQWIVPNNPEENTSNQPKHPFQLEPYLLNQAGKLLPLLSTKTTELKDPLKSNSIPFIQIEPPTRLDSFFLQVQNIQKWITQGTYPEIHILIMDGQKEPEGSTSKTIFTSLIHQTIQQTNKKLVLYKPTTQSTLKNVGGLPFSTQIEPITTIGKKLNGISTK